MIEDAKPRECAEELMGRARCPAATRPAESEGDYVRRMFRELHRRLVLPPEHGADSIDAAIGYALIDCEEKVMAALYASNTTRQGPSDPSWAHTAQNDPAGLYDDQWEPRHD